MDILPPIAFRIIILFIIWCAPRELFIERSPVEDPLDAIASLIGPQRRPFSRAGTIQMVFGGAAG